MILRINRSTSQNSKNTAEKQYITSSVYPEQKKDYLNKVLLLRYRTYLIPEIINNRFYVNKSIYTSYTGENSGTRSFFLVLRYDNAEPYKAILLGPNGEVIVAKTTDIEALTYPVGYTTSIITNSSILSPYGDRTELKFTNATTYDGFVSSYQNEHIYDYPVQDDKLIGATVYTEFEKDIYDSTLTNKLEQSTHKTKSELSSEILKADPLLSIYPTENILSYTSYRDTHYMDKVDTPTRVINSGIIIRKDLGSSDKDNIVVAEIIDNTMRFITSSEANFYIKDFEDANTVKYNAAKFVTLIPKYTFKGE